MEILLAASLLFGMFSMAQPSAGTYAMTQSGATLVRMDTRTGTIERCSLIGNEIDCKPTVATPGQTKQVEK